MQNPMQPASNYDMRRDNNLSVISGMSGQPRVSSTDLDEPIAVTQVTERELMDSCQIFASFNQIMDEELTKIKNNTYQLYRSASFKQNNKEVIPCDFLRFVANIDDDLEELAFQLHANHSNNFPEQRVTAMQKQAQHGESFGHKIFKLFRPNAATE